MARLRGVWAISRRHTEMVLIYACIHCMHTNTHKHASIGLVATGRRWSSLLSDPRKPAAKNTRRRH